MVIYSDGGAPHEKFVKMAVTLWSIWYARRKLIHEGINQSPLSTHLFVTRFIAKLDQLQQKKDQHVISAPRVVSPRVWRPPPEGTVKINVDVGV